MAVDDEIKKIFDKEKLPKEVQEAIKGQLKNDDQKNDLIDKNNNFNPSVFLNYIDIHSNISKYLELPKDNYGTGTSMAIASLATYATAKEKRIDFWDIQHAHDSKSDKKEDIIKTGLENCTGKTLMLGNLRTEGKDEKFEGETLEKLLASTEFARFDTVIMPVSLFEKDSDLKWKRRHRQDHYCRSVYTFC